MKPFNNDLDEVHKYNDTVNKNNQALLDNIIGYCNKGGISLDDLKNNYKACLFYSKD